MGCPALTTRGLTEEDFEQVGEFFHRAVQISVDIKGKTGTKLKDFKAALANGPQDFPDLVKLANDVKTFSNQFPAIGVVPK